MPVKNRFAELLPEISAWRQDFHAHPELRFDLPRTTGKVVELLRSFGVDEVVEGVGQSGVVAVIKGRTDTAGRVIGFRADMDALPIVEATGLPHASTTAGKMHACGHDGHTSILLGAAKYLAETRQFDGTVVLAFQPAEEGGGGARASGRCRADRTAGASRRSMACTTCRVSRPANSPSRKARCWPPRISSRSP